MLFIKKQGPLHLLPVTAGLTLLLGLPLALALALLLALAILLLLLLLRTTTTGSTDHGSGHLGGGVHLYSNARF